MSVKDKLEIGLKPDAPYRPDNLPESEQDTGENPEQRAERDDGFGSALARPETPPGGTAPGGEARRRHAA